MGQYDHNHIEESGASLVRAARLALEAGGEAWTNMRAQMFVSLAGLTKPASAYEIADLVSQARGKRVAPNSVYRILDVFVANNLVRRVESVNAFVVNRHPSCLHDCIFLICDDCRQTVHVDDDSLSADVRAAAKVAGFSVMRPVIEVRGRCSDCQQRSD